MAAAGATLVAVSICRRLGSSLLVVLALTASGCRTDVTDGRAATDTRVTDSRDRFGTVPDRNIDRAPDREQAGTERDTRTADRRDEHATLATCSRKTATVETIIYRTTTGVPAEQLSLDLHRPAGCDPRALLIWVHGGGWTGGDKHDATTAVKAAWAHRNGWAFVSVNYRLTGSGGARWPDHGDDIVDAVNAIRQRAVDLGVDADRVALLGHSAGGHIVTHIVSGPHRQRFTTEPSRGEPVDCVVSLDGVGYQLEGNPMVSRRTVNAVFGSTPEELRTGSPQHQIDQWGPPAAEVLVVTRGSDVNRRLAQEFRDTIDDQGGRALLLDVSPYDHGAAASMLGMENETTLTGPVTTFLRSCLSRAGIDADPQEVAHR